MDSEEFYDSLDEDSNYGSLESLEDPVCNVEIKKNFNYSKIPVKLKIQPQRNVTETNLNEIDDIIPFYDHNLNKSEINLKKMYRKQGDMNGFEKESKKKGKKGVVIPLNVSGRSKTNSYLDMFYAKNGVDRIDLSTRATCTDLSPKSFVTCEDFEILSSVEFSEIKSAYSNIKNLDEFSLSLTSLDSRFCSVSQINSGKMRDKPKKCQVKTCEIKIADLGGLGPEIPKEKLELLKKRQDYGRKVSRNNKIKMMEKQLLQNLKEEIRECKNVV